MSKNLAESIAEALDDYSYEVVEALGAAVDTVAKKVNSVIKEHITFDQRTGKYVKAFRIRDVSRTSTERKKAWYVASPHYCLSHLLEKGHITRNGGRTRAFPHIKYGEEYAEANLENEFKKELENDG